MPKILISIINNCYRCDHIRTIDMRNHKCLEKDNKLIETNIFKEIPKWCELPEYGYPLPDADTEITGIPCSHVAPEGVCERCGEEVKDE